MQFLITRSGGLPPVLAPVLIPVLIPVLVLVLVLVMAAGPPAAAAVAVSPGAPGAAAVAGTPCPTFTWTPDPGASSQEIVVYRVVPGSEEPAAEPVLRRSLPAGVAAWVPEGDACLEPGGRYAWSVRSLDADGAGEWLDPVLFEVGEARGDDTGIGGGAPSRLGEGPPPGQEVTFGVVDAEEIPVQRSAGAAPTLFSVGGSVAVAGSYRFAAPRPRDLQLPPAAFGLQTNLEDEGWIVDPAGYGYIASAAGGASVALVAPVTLPVGATVQQFTCYAYDGDPGEAMSMQLRLRRRLAGSRTSEVVAQVSLVTDGPTASPDVLYGNDFSIEPPLVEQYYDYWIEGVFGVGAAGPGLRFYGCLVSHQVDRLGPG